MKHWKCPDCFKTKQTNDNIVISFCPACLTIMEINPCCLLAMEEIKKEVKEDGDII